MTSDQSSQLPERTHGAELDAHLDALGSALDRGIQRAEQRRRRTRVGAGAATALVAVGLGALVVLPGGRDLDPVAEARAAVGADGGGILHYVVRSKWLPPSGSASRSTLPDPIREVWTATEGAAQFRMREPADGRPRSCGVVTYFVPKRGVPLREQRGERGPMLVSPGDYAFDPTTTTTYSAYSRAAVIVTRPTPATAESPAGPMLVPGFGGDDTRDPVRTIRQALRAGRLEEGGAADIGGRAVRRLVGRDGPSPEQARELDRRPYAARRAFRARQLARGAAVDPTRYEYFVDADTYAPVEMRTHRYAVWSRAGGRPHWKWTGTIDRFERFERLSDTPANRTLLAIPLPAGTKIYRSGPEGGIRPRVSFKQAMREAKSADRRCQADLER